MLTARDYLYGQVGANEETGLAVVAYARVSHEESAESGLSIPQQLENIRGYCAHKGWQIVAEFTDEGASAYRESENRPAFREMIAFCLTRAPSENPVRHIVVDKFDRFSRDEFVNAYYKHHLLPQHGITVVSVSEPYDTTTVGGWLAQRITELTAVARSMEDAQNTMRAMLRNVREGHSCGGRPPWGYRRVSVPVGTTPKGEPITRTDWEPDPAVAPHVRELFELLASGVSLYSIAASFTRRGIPSPSGKPYWTKTTVYDLARRVYVYEGTRLWNVEKKSFVRTRDGRQRLRMVIKDPRLWVRVENAYPAIISPQVASRVRCRFPFQYDSPERYERWLRRTRSGKRTPPEDGINNAARNGDFILTGLARCGYCGGNLVSYRSKRHADGRRWRAYRCGVYHRSGKSACRSYYISAADLEDAVLGAVERQIGQVSLTPREIDRYVAQMRRLILQRVAAASRQVEALTQKISRTIEDGLDRGLDPEACNLRIARLKEEMARYVSERNTAQKMLDKLEAAADDLRVLLSRAITLRDVRNEPAALREILRQVVHVVVVHPQRRCAEIHFRLPGAQAVSTPYRARGNDECGDDAPGNHPNSAPPPEPIESVHCFE